MAPSTVITSLTYLEKRYGDRGYFLLLYHCPYESQQRQHHAILHNISVYCIKHRENLYNVIVNTAHHQCAVA